MNGLEASRPPTREEFLFKLREDKSYEYGEDFKKTMWKTTADCVNKHSDDMIDRWDRGIDSLLTFAGLFSAILTAFNVQSYQLLQVAPADETITILMQISAQLSSFVVNQSFVNSTQPAFSASPPVRPFRAPLYAIWVNALWFSSLIFSLWAATVGIIAKQWLSEHRALPSGTSREIARHYQYRLDGLRRWKISMIISAIPVLLLIALILFLVGLLILLWNINDTVFATTATFASLLFLFIAITTVLPTIVADCRYYSPQARAAVLLCQPLEQIVKWLLIGVIRSGFIIWVFVIGRYPSRYSFGLPWRLSTLSRMTARVLLDEQLDRISSSFPQSVRKPREKILATTRNTPDWLALDAKAAITAYKSTSTREDFAAPQVLLAECPDHDHDHDHEISRTILTQCRQVLTDCYGEDSSKWPKKTFLRYCSLLRCALHVSLVSTAAEDEEAWKETWRWVIEVIDLVPDTTDAASNTAKLPRCYRILQHTGPGLLSKLRTMAMVSMGSTYDDRTAQDAWQSILCVIQRAQTGQLKEEHIEIVIAVAARRITESGRKLNQDGDISSQVLNDYIGALCASIRCLAELPSEFTTAQPSGTVYAYTTGTLKAFGGLLNIPLWREICADLRAYEIPYDAVVSELHLLSKQMRFHQLILDLIPYLQCGYEEMTKHRNAKITEREYEEMSKSANKEMSEEQKREQVVERRTQRMHQHLTRCRKELDNLKTRLGVMPGQNAN